MEIESVLSGMLVNKTALLIIAITIMNYFNRMANAVYFGFIGLLCLSLFLCANFFLDSYFSLLIYSFFAIIFGFTALFLVVPGRQAANIAISLMLIFLTSKLIPLIQKEISIGIDMRGSFFGVINYSSNSFAVFSVLLSLFFVFLHYYDLRGPLRFACQTISVGWPDFKKSMIDYKSVIFILASRISLGMFLYGVVYLGRDVFSLNDFDIAFVFEVMSYDFIIISLYNLRVFREGGVLYFLSAYFLIPFLFVIIFEFIQRFTVVTVNMAKINLLIVWGGIVVLMLFSLFKRNDVI